MSKPINWIKLSSRRTDQITENTLQEMAASLFSRKRRSKGHEQELREELLQSPRIGIENYPSRKALATHLSDSHSSTFSDLTLSSPGFFGSSQPGGGAHKVPPPPSYLFCYWAYNGKLVKCFKLYLMMGFCWVNGL